MINFWLLGLPFITWADYQVWNCFPFNTQNLSNRFDICVDTGSFVSNNWKEIVWTHILTFMVTYVVWTELSTEHSQRQSALFTYHWDKTDTYLSQLPSVHQCLADPVCWLHSHWSILQWFAVTFLWRNEGCYTSASLSFSTTRKTFTCISTSPIKKKIAHSSVRKY